MTKIKKNLENGLNIFDKNDFNQILESAKLEYHSDIEWSYHTETKNYCIDFRQDESGKNHIEEFAICKKNTWIIITPTKEQVQLMFDKLNKTPYRENETFTEPIYDAYDYFGVQQSNFY